MSVLYSSAYCNLCLMFQEKRSGIRLTVENKFLCMNFMTKGSMKGEREKKQQCQQCLRFR